MIELRKDFVERIRQGLDKRIEEEKKINGEGPELTGKFVNHELENFDKLLKSDLGKMIMDGEER